MIDLEFLGKSLGGSDQAMSESDSQVGRLVALGRLFGWLGLIGFGGPQAHIAMQNAEVVERRGWLTATAFSDGLAMCELLPGPASTQMGIYIGYVRAGILGALVAGVAFILPAFVMVVGLAWAYFRFQALPQVSALFFGLAPVMIAIIVGFCWKLGRKAINDWLTGALAVFALFCGALTDFSTLLVLLGSGMIGLLFYGRKRLFGGMGMGFGFGFAQPWGAWAENAVICGLPLSASGFWSLERIETFCWPLFAFFFKVGAFIFGGGLVIIPLLEASVVDRFNWLTLNEFIDGVAIGQLSPGPVVITAAFIGYKVAGFLGALVATVGIFTPSFIFILAAAPLLLKLRDNLWLKDFLKGVKPAVVGVIAAATIPLGRTAFMHKSGLVSGGAIAIAITAFIALDRLKLQTWQVILAAGILGLAIYPLLAI
jgi:chromate transporter